MRIGLLLEFHAGDYDQPMPDPAVTHATMDAMIEEALTAERHGFHSVSVPDRHGRTGMLLPRAVPGAHDAGPRDRPGGARPASPGRDADAPDARRRDVLGHRQHVRGAAVHDAVARLSRGYWKQFGVPREKLLGRFIESLAVTKEALLGGRFDFEGKHYQVEDGLLVPQPYQPGGWPIWGGGNAVDAAIRRSADYGECWTCDDFPLRPDVWERQSASIAIARVSSARSPTSC